MPRLILTAVLALTQLISWSGAPLYLCLGCDGSVALDFGPSGCQHCKHAAGHSKKTATVCCNHRSGHRHLAAARTLERMAVVHACGCRHIQLSQPNSPVVVRAQRTGDQHRSLALIAATISAHSFDNLANSSALGLQRHLSDSNLMPSPTTLISSVVLRC